MLQGWRHKVVTILLCHDCIGLVGRTLQQIWYININKVVTSCLTACSKLVDNLGQAVRTQLVDGLFANLLQDFYVCIASELYIYISIDIYRALYRYIWSSLCIACSFLRDLQTARARMIIYRTQKTPKTIHDILCLWYSFDKMLEQWHIIIRIKWTTCKQLKAIMHN
jgi:hypothetical protein